MQQRSARIGALEAALDRPLRKLLPSDLAQHWRRSTLSIRVERPVGLEGGAWMAAALRGAIGRRLIALADESELAAEALFLLFHADYPLTARLSIPKPMVLSVTVEGNELLIDVTLFGVFDYWREIVFDAAIDALRNGLPLKERGQMRVAWPVREALWQREESITIESVNPFESRLRFLTPLRLGGRSAGGHGLDVGDLILSLLDRVSGIARWNFVALDGQWSAWRSQSRQLRVRYENMLPGDWERASSRGHAHVLAMPGWYLDFVIERPPAELVPILRLGATTFAGADAAQGMGRYVVL
jgi:hypothetical protein